MSRFGAVIRSRFKIKHATTLVLLVALAVLPLLLGGGLFSTYLITRFGVAITLVLGCNLWFGYLGQINFGYQGFYCIGAYMFALMFTRLGMPFLVVLPLTILGSFVIGLLLAIPLIRLRGHFLALGTFAMGMCIYLLSNMFPNFNGGENGMYVKAQIFGLKLEGTPSVYFILIMTVLTIWICDRLIASKLGWAMTAIRDDEEAASACGINISRFKLFNFALTAVFGAFAGIIWSLGVGFIQPDMFGTSFMITLLLMMIVGGMGNNLGAIIGAVAIVLLEEYTISMSSLQPLIMTGVLVVALIFMPGGIIGLYVIKWGLNKTRFTRSRSDLG